ncbi:hypothetical protein [uncultured Campylobacter sp.]|uniref:hypothetical protein n=1 Tax=uncultured Campylobacter sp. TaxID=218934 RepID=UPI0026143082|nr:hypothetical protein [uncultured Campylobacter sp.]
MSEKICGGRKFYRRGKRILNSASEQLRIAIATLMRLKDRISNRGSLKKKTEF